MTPPWLTYAVTVSERKTSEPASTRACRRRLAIAPFELGDDGICRGAVAYSPLQELIYVIMGIETFAEE